MCALCHKVRQLGHDGDLRPPGNSATWELILARPHTIGGHKTDKLFRDAIMLAVKRSDETGEDPRPYLARIAEACVQKALGGDMAAIKEIGDRLDGKPKQQVDLGTDGDLAIAIIDARSKREVDKPSE